MNLDAIIYVAMLHFEDVDMLYFEDKCEPEVWFVLLWFMILYMAWVLTLH